MNNFKNKIVSILVPVYNEAENIPEFIKAIKKVFQEIEIQFEIIFVNDGSTDKSFETLHAAAHENENIILISLSRNFGKEAALTCALDYCKSDCGIPMDADMQDPPEIIPDLIAKWHEGYDIVLARRINRESDSYVKRVTSKAFYKVFNSLSETKIYDDVGDFRLLDKKVIKVVNELTEKNRFMKGLLSWPGFNVSVIDYKRPERHQGKTKFSLHQLSSLAISGILSFSSTPIKSGIYLGLSISMIAMFYALWIITKTLIYGVDTPGYASLMVVTLFLGGTQLLFIGLLGEYISKIYNEVKNRPIYIISSIYGMRIPNKADNNM